MYFFPLLVLPFPECCMMELYSTEPLESASSTWSDLLHPTTDDTGAPSLFVVGRPVHSRVFSSSPGLHPLDANSITPPPQLSYKKYLQILPDVPWWWVGGGQNHPWLRTNDLE